MVLRSFGFRYASLATTLLLLHVLVVVKKLRTWKMACRDNLDSLRALCIQHYFYRTLHYWLCCCVCLKVAAVGNIYLKSKTKQEILNCAAHLLHLILVIKANTRWVASSRDRIIWISVTFRRLLGFRFYYFVFVWPLSLLSLPNVNISLHMGYFVSEAMGAKLFPMVDRRSCCIKVYSSRSHLSNF